MGEDVVIGLAGREIFAVAARTGFEPVHRP